jgi:hypothetical protein
MATFQLKKAADTYEFDMSGKVKKNGAAFGKWSTNADNKILAKDNTSEVAFDGLAWSFADNALLLKSNGQKVIDFNEANGESLSFSVGDKAVLQVIPLGNDDENAFRFDLHGEWKLTEKHDLSITLNNVESVLDGYVDDPATKFSFFFFDEDDNSFNLVFMGQWENLLPDETGKLKIRFQYEAEKPDASGLTKRFFMLPKEVTMDRTVNQFVYKYEKGKQRLIKFVGVLNVTSDFHLTYSLARQERFDGQVAVKSTEFRVAAVLKNDKFTGDIEFFIKKQSGTVTTSVIGIKGKFTADFKGNILAAGFAFVQESDGFKKKNTVLFNGTLKLKNNLTQVDWAFAINDNVKTLTITITDVQLGPATLNSKVVLENGPNKRSVLFLLGFKV